MRALPGFSRSTAMSPGMVLITLPQHNIVCCTATVL